MSEHQEPMDIPGNSTQKSPKITVIWFIQVLLVPAVVFMWRQNNIELHREITQEHAEKLQVQRDKDTQMDYLRYMYQHREDSILASHTNIMKEQNEEIRHIMGIQDILPQNSNKIKKEIHKISNSIQKIQSR